MAGERDGIGGRSHLLVFRSLRNKLLLLMILLSLLPLAGLALASYFFGSKQIAEDRIKLTLEKMAQDTADKIDLFLREKKEEAHSMANIFPLLYPDPSAAQRDGITRFLNNICFNHEVYDLFLVIDNRGNVLAINSSDRYGARLPEAKIERILAGGIAEFPEEKNLFLQAVKGLSAHQDWYPSRVAQQLYNYQGEDITQSYNISLAEPLRNPANNEIVGVWISILNWAYFQNLLDNVEMDLSRLQMPTGYAFMFARDENTIIGHKYRANRTFEGAPASPPVANLYGSRLVEDLGLRSLHDAISAKLRSHAYEFPRGNRKISGLAPIEDNALGWIVGVGIDDADIFRPIHKLTWWLIGLTAALAALVTTFTYIVAHGITVPLKNMIRSARIIAQGNLNQRVSVNSWDEVGILGSTFNDMARALEARELQLQELNRNLERMVRQRTFELEKSHDALKQAYEDLQSAQDQLVQTEKMASLGQLVAGIAHEIKNPLNFIYGNTGFLTDYVNKLQALIGTLENLPSLSEADRAEMVRQKETMNYSFIREDLKTLIDNFAEGARRINNIVSDLRTFSRMDTDTLSELDVHTSLEMSLNLLRNQYKNRITIHRDYANIPKIQGYAGKLNQVFMNLLSNAFHAIRDAGDVWIRTHSGNGAVEIEIEDSGAGIPKENLNRIFEPFFTTKPVGQGTGLGLSISYGIIQQHHGEIHVSSTPEKGSKFTVRLPVFQEGAQA